MMLELLGYSIKSVSKGKARKKVLAYFGPEKKRWVKKKKLTKKPANKPNKAKKKTYKSSYGGRAKGFYDSKAWRVLRYEVIREQGAKCSCCGRTPQEHGIVIHVDHIKPRSKYPELELVKSNMQILCEECNMGKVNTDEIDWHSRSKNKNQGR